MKPLKPSFYARDTVIVAQELLGKPLVRIIDDQVLAGIIVETEAYMHANDPASHAHIRSVKLLENKKIFRDSPRKSIFGPVGHAYVYFIYGNHFCLNAVSHDETAIAGGVLIRAIMPTIGIEAMRSNRIKSDDKNLTNGPGKLTQALQITRMHDGKKFAEENGLYIAHGEQISLHDIIATPRIGISKAQDKLWRFVIK